MLSTELWEEENKSTVCDQCIRSRTHAQYVISVVTLTACRCFLLLSEFWCEKSAQLQSLNFNIRMMVNVWYDHINASLPIWLTFCHESTFIQL